MKFIKITSKGEIDDRAFSLMGASPKRNDNTKIGMFGSGLKYSLAYLLNKKIPLKVFSGYREVKFETQEEDFRGKSVFRIYVNGEKTSLTTDMGMDWESWFVLREIYCNALDESEASVSIVNFKSIDDIPPIEDFTAFYIKVNKDFQEVIDNWDLYFSDKRKDLLYHDSDMNQIYVGGDFSLFYRMGIRCQYNETLKALFHYDMSWIKINESRIIANDWDFKYDLCKYLKAVNDEGVIHRLVYNINNYFEKNLYWQCCGDFSDAWKIIIGDKYLIPYENAGFWEEEIKLLKSDCIVLPTTLISSLKLYFGDDIKVIGDDEVKGSKGEMKIVEIGKREQFLLDESLDFLKSIPYEVKYPIKVVRFTKPEILGQAKDEIIYLSDKLFTMGRKEVVSAIIEENEHNNTGYSDETRTFQTHLINLLITSFEDRSGKYL